ncbi:MAG: (5-formylfuran-3-yl)methyl phosphate synthase [Candidatus Hydrothermarchaeales archaeon]
MKLLISPINPEEAKAATEGGADIIDIKNPREGSLGASFPWMITEIKDALPRHLEISATLGDMDNRPGFASLAAYGLSLLDVEYIKAGLLVHKRKEALELAMSIVKAAEGSGSKVVLAGYGDFRGIRSINPVEIPEIARTSGAHGVMIDTYTKNGTSLFGHMGMEELETFVEEGKVHGLTVAIAGSITASHIPKLKTLKPHIVGVRGAVCTKNDRIHGKIEKEKVKEFKRQLID